MEDEVVTRVAFALQDEGMTRLKAQKLARAALASIQVGDRLGGGMIVSQEVSTDMHGANDVVVTLARERNCMSNYS